MKRYLFDNILKDLRKKIVFITGPRQVGKTYLAKELMQLFRNPQYLNYDNLGDRRIIAEQGWLPNSELIVFDELHKMNNWKNYLKGVFDKKEENQSILVTGSARLDTFRQTGDSLAGRYFHFRLNPFSVEELKNIISPYEVVNKLNKFGGFPEPILQSLSLDEDSAIIESNRWKKQYYTDLIREDIFEFSRITEINVMKTLVEVLRTKIGSPISYNSIAEDLQVSPNTIKKYVNILESLYVIFQIRPFHKNIARSLLKEPKIYFYDSSFVKGDEGIKLENTVAVSLLKHVQFLQDVYGKESNLGYLKTKDGKEIDFVLGNNDLPEKFIEVKLSNKKIDPNLRYFAERFPQVESIQLVHHLRQEEVRDSIQLLTASKWLANLSA